MMQNSFYKYQVSDKVSIKWLLRCYSAACHNATDGEKYA